MRISTADCGVCALVLSSMGLVGPTALAAQDPGIARAESGASRDELEEVVVTAQRRTEDLQKIAVAATALTGDELQDKAVTRLDELQFAAPALTVTDAGLSQSVNIRGVGLASGSPSVTNGVATYVDGVFQPPIASTGSFYDVATVEVFRGPQGTFVGSASTGGAIFINSRSPQLGETNGYAEVTLGDHSTQGAQAAINIPAGETLAFRFAGNYRSHDSYSRDVGPFDSDAGKLDETAGRVGVLWKPTDSFQALFKSDLSEHNTGGYAYRPIESTQYAPLRSSGPRELTYDDPTRNDEGASQTTLELRQEAFGGVTFRYLGGYQDKHISNLYDTDATIQPQPPTGQYPRQTMDQYVRELVVTHEINVISPTEGAVDWIVGGYWQQNRINVDIVSSSDAFLTDILVDTKKTTTGLFAQLGYKFTPTLKMDVGARYSTFDVSGSGSVTIGRGVPFPPFNNVGLKVADLGGSHDDGRPTGKVALEWTPDANNMYYAFIAEGYKPGGSNSATDEFDPETVTDFELGWKATLLDGHLRTQLGGFWYDYKGFQQQGVDPATGQSGTQNIADATIRGLEAQAQARIGGWGFDIGMAYVDSSLGDTTFVNTRTLPSGTNLPQCTAGNVPPTCFDYGPYMVTATGGPMLFAPEFTFNAGVEYTFPIGTGTLRPRINYGFIGSQWTTLLYSPVTDRLAERGLLSAQVTYQRDAWVVEAYGTNLTDKLYISGQSGNNEFYGAPREYGIRASWRF